MWDNTLLLWSSDNGGAVHLHGGANSYPLRGGYMNNVIHMNNARMNSHIVHVAT